MSRKIGLAGVAILLSATVLTRNAAADASLNCEIFWDTYSSGVGLVSIWVGGANYCRQTMPAMSGLIILRDATNSFVEASGNNFSCTACATDGSSSRACCFVVGVPHYLDYTTTLTLPSGHTWSVLPSECAGTETAVASCHIVQLIPAMGALGGCICEGSRELEAV